MNDNGKCCKCHRITYIHHPFKTGVFICNEHYYKLKNKLPISKIPSINEINLSGDGITDHILINKDIGEVCKTDLSFSEKLEIIENKLDLYNN